MSAVYFGLLALCSSCVDLRTMTELEETFLLIPLIGLLARATNLHSLKLFVEFVSSGQLANSWSHSRLCGGDL